MLRGLFARRAGQGEPDRDATARVKALALRILDPLAGASVTVSEIVCHDPACPGTETILLLALPGEKLRAVKVAAAAADVTEQELRAVLVVAEPGERR